MRFFGWCLLAAGLAAACGGSITSDGAGGGDGGAAGASGAGGSSSGGVGSFPPPVTKDGGGPVRPDSGPGDSGVFVDPGCPDVAPNPITNECDPFATFNECGPGLGCYPFVDYPSGKCGQERYGSICAPAGSGTQGDSCGAVNCAPGFVCVTGTGQGVICVKMCRLDRPDDCPPGLLCGAVDVAGIGGCY